MHRIKTYCFDIRIHYRTLSLYSHYFSKQMFKYPADNMIIPFEQNFKIFEMVVHIQVAIKMLS